MRGGWTDAEDQKLTSLMQCSPVPSWKELSEVHLPSRTVSQLRHRWHDTLKAKKSGVALGRPSHSMSKTVSAAKAMRVGDKTALSEEAQSVPSAPRKRTTSFYNNTLAQAHATVPSPRVQHDVFFPDPAFSAPTSALAPPHPSSSDASSFSLSPPRARLAPRRPTLLLSNTPRRVSRTSNTRLAPSSSPVSSEFVSANSSSKRRQVGLGTLELLERLGESPKRGRVAKLLIDGEEGKENESTVEVRRGLLFR